MNDKKVELAIDIIQRKIAYTLKNNKDVDRNKVKNELQRLIK